MTSPASPLSNKTACGFSPFTAACTSLSVRSVAIEVDPTCAVSLLVLGDSGCSQPGQIMLMYG